MTLAELKQKFIDRHYIIDDKLLWWTYMKVCQLESNASSKEINALGIFGPSGSGKTTYVNILKDILSEELDINIELVSCICNADKRTTMVKDEDNIDDIDKDYFIDAINKANNGKKVILFIDCYDNINILTDIFLAKFIQTGIITDNEKTYVELRDKKNLQIIIAGNDNSNIAVPLQNRLNIAKTNYLNSSQILEYLDYETPNCEETIKCLIMYLYNKCEKIFGYSKLSSILNVSLLVKNVQFLVNSHAPVSVIYEIILEGILKGISNHKEYYDRFKIDSINELKEWDNNIILDQLIMSLDYNSEFDVLLLNKLKKVPDTKNIIIPQKTTFSLIEAFKKNVEGFNNIGVVPFKKYPMLYDEIENNQRDWKYYDILDEDINRKWFKVAELDNCYLYKTITKVEQNGEGIGAFHYFYPNEEDRYFNKFILVRHATGSKLVADMSIYSSEPIIDCFQAKRLLEFLNLKVYSNCKVNFALVADKTIENETFLSLTESDPYFPNIYYYNEILGQSNISVTNKNKLYNLLSEIDQFKEINTYLKTRGCYFMIPTSEEYYLQKAKLFKNANKISKLGEMKIVAQNHQLIKDEYETLFNIISGPAGEIYKSYMSERSRNNIAYNPECLFLVKKAPNLIKELKEIQKGIYIVDESKISEFLLINPFLAFCNIDNHKENLYAANVPFVKRLVI